MNNTFSNARKSEKKGNLIRGVREPIGNGSLYQVSKGKWKYDFYYKVNGEKFRKVFNAKTRAEAIRKRLDFLDLPEYVDGDKLLTCDLLDKWFYDYVMVRHKSKGNAESTLIKLESVVRLHIYNQLIYTTIDQLTDDNVEQLVFSRLREQDENGKYKYSVSMFNKVFNALKDFCDWCVLREYLKYNPTRDIIKVSVKANPPREILFYNEEQIKKLIQVCLSKGRTTHKYSGKSDNEYTFRYGLAHIVQLETGMREGEIIALKWENVDLKKKEITVVSTVTVATTRESNNMKEYAIVHIEKKGTKTIASFKRKIPLSNIAYQCLVKQKELQIEEFGTTVEYVFANTKRKRMYIRYYDNSLSKVCDCAKIPYQGTHSLRHTFASRLFARKVPIKVISTLLGHASTRITEDIYIHVIDELRQDAIRELNNTLPLDNKEIESLFDDFKSEEPNEELNEQPKEESTINTN